MIFAMIFAMILTTIPPYHSREKQSHRRVPSRKLIRGTGFPAHFPPWYSPRMPCRARIPSTQPHPMSVLDANPGTPRKCISNTPKIGSSMKPFFFCLLPAGPDSASVTLKKKKKKKKRWQMRRVVPIRPSGAQSKLSHLGCDRQNRVAMGFWGSWRMF